MFRPLCMLCLVLALAGSFVNVSHASVFLGPYDDGGSEIDSKKLSEDFLARKSPSGVTTYPVILVPGLGGSQVESKLDHSYVPRWECFNETTKHWERVWIAAMELLPWSLPCWRYRLELEYDGEVNRNRPGVQIRPHDFGGVDGVRWLDPALKKESIYMDPLIETLTKTGYVVGKTLFGAPADWRYAATDKELDPFYDILKNMVEQAFNFSGSLPTNIIGHSLGCNIAHQFLIRQSDDWKQKYIRSFIPISGPFLGKFILSGDTLGIPLPTVKALSMRPLYRTLPSIASTIPFPGQLPDESIVSTPSRNYSTSEYSKLFGAAGLEKLMGWFPDIPFKTPKAPQVATHCIHSFNVTTHTHLHYEKEGFDKMPKFTKTLNGDGTVPAYSLEKCWSWASEQTAPVTKFLEPNVIHRGTVANKAIIEHVLSLVTE